MKRIIVLLIAIVLCCNSLIGCRASENTDVLDTSVEPKSFQQTETVLVSNKMTDYQIVIPKKSTAMEKYAANELQTFLYKSTGAMFNVITDNEISHDNNQKLLSVGNTTLLAEQTDIVIDYDVHGETGPLIYTKDNTVYMCGAGDYGILYSVYKFLEYQIGFKSYASDCTVFNYYSELKLLDFAYNYVPSIPWLLLNEWDTKMSGDPADSARMYRLSTAEGGDDIFGTNFYNGLWVHSGPRILFPKVLPYVDEATGETKERNTMPNGQPCFTDPEVYEFVVNKLKSMILTFKGPAVMFGIEDGAYKSCNCDGCIKAEQTYGSAGGVMMAFVNKIAKDMDEYLQEVGSDKTFNFLALAYHAYETAPIVIENADGTYSSANEELNAYKGKNIETSVCVAPITACAIHPLGDTGCSYNDQFTQNIKKWAVYAPDNMHMYIYGANFTTSHSFYFNEFMGIAGTFKFFKDLGVEHVYDEATGEYFSTLSALKVYYKSRLAWNCNADVYEIIDEFLNAYYGPAAKEMREYFDALNNQYSVVFKGSDAFHFDCHVNHALQACWPYSTMKSFESILTTALSRIEHSDYTEEQKDAYYERVYREFIVHKYNEWELYKNDVEYSEKLELDKYAEIAKKVYGMTNDITGGDFNE